MVLALANISSASCVLTLEKKGGGGEERGREGSEGLERGIGERRRERGGDNSR